MGLGVLMSGWGIALLGFFESYTAMLFCIAVSSIGLALYHPDGGRMANFVSGKAKGKGVSNFSFGGNLSGFVGPVLTVFAVSHFGMHGTIIIAIPATLMALWLFSLNSRFLKFAEEGQKEMATAMKAGQKDDWHGFMRLFFVTIMRSAIMNGMNTFIPLFWLSILMQTEETSGLITSLIALAGAFATLTGGRMSDKLGYKNMIRTGLIALVPCMAIAALHALYFRFGGNFIFSRILSKFSLQPLGRPRAKAHPQPHGFSLRYHHGFGAVIRWYCFSAFGQSRRCPRRRLGHVDFGRNLCFSSIIIHYFT